MVKWKHIYLLTFLFIAAVITSTSAMVACQPLKATATATADTAARVTAVYYEIETGHIVNILSSAQLSDPEILVVIQTLDTIKAARENLKAYIDDPSLLAANPQPIETEYQKIASAYRAAKAIAQRHKTEYPPGDWQTLTTFDAEITALQQSYQAAREQLQHAAAVASAYRMAKTAAMLAASL